MRDPRCARLLLPALCTIVLLPCGAQEDFNPKGVKLTLGPNAVVLQPRTAVLLPLTGKQAGARVLRASLHAALSSSTALRLVDPAAVDAVLAQHGVSGDLSEHELDMLREWFGCDTVLFAHCSKWARVYVLVQSQVTVGLTVKAVDAHTGELLAEVSATRTRGAGLSRIPVGLMGAAVSPLKGLHSRVLYDLAGEAAHAVALALTDPACIDPALPVPNIADATYAIAHPDLPNARPVLTVTVNGTPGARGFYHFGAPNNAWEMTESVPGIYTGLMAVAPRRGARQVNLHATLALPGGGAATHVLQPPLEADWPR